MAKIAKAAAKTAAQKSDKDLFSDLPEPRRAGSPPGRRAPPSPRAGPRRGYTARDIEVLEGLEPVRRRPGMYIGGTDEKALHHLFAEVIDNSMDEALDGHATFIEVEMEADGFVTVTDNGRGIPVDPHPKFPEEVRARSDHVHAARGRQVRLRRSTRPRAACTASASRSSTRCPSAWRSRSRASRRSTAWCSSAASRRASWRSSAARPTGAAPRCASSPIPQIFGAKAQFKPERIFKMARSKAYLFGGVEIRWSCAKELLQRRRGRAGAGDLPFRRRAQGLSHRGHQRRRRWCIPTSSPAAPARSACHGAAQWAVAWTGDADGFLSSYCNTIPTPDGGTHESGLRSALLKGLKDHAERMGQGKRAAADDQRRRDDRRRLHALGVHPRAGIPGPDQGPARDRGSHAHRRERDQGSVRPLARRQSRRRPTSCSTSWSSAPRSASAAARRRRFRARPRCASCACPASSPTAPTPPRKARRSSSSRATPPAARPSRRATAPRRRCCRCAARSSTSPPPARTSSRRTSSSPIWCRRSAAAPARTIATRTCATRR